MTTKQTTKNKHLPRELSLIGSDSYNRSLRRSFARAKLLAFFNPDLTQFITFTYKSNQLSPDQTLKDIKLFLKKQKTYNNINQSPLSLRSPDSGVAMSREATRARHLPDPRLPEATAPTALKETEPLTRQRLGATEESARREVGAEIKAEKGKGDHKQPFKYIYVLERQKRGAIHVHMVTNGLFKTRRNKNGYRELVGWNHGFSSVLDINNTDNNFKPYLYLFKYMGKAQRVGRSFIHTSRTFDKIENVDYALYINKLKGANLLFKEDYEISLDGKQSRIIKEYYKTASPYTKEAKEDL